MAGIYELLVFAHVLGFALWLAGAAAASLTGRAAFDVNLPIDTRLVCLQLRFAGQVLSRTGLATLLPVGFTLLSVGQYGALPSIVTVLTWLVGLAWLALIWIPRLVPVNLTEQQLLLAEVGACGLAAVLTLAIGLPSILGLGPLPADWPGMKAVIGGLVYALTGALTWFITPKEEQLASSTANSKLARVLSLGVLVLYVLMVLGAWIGNIKPTF